MGLYKPSLPPGWRIEVRSGDAYRYKVSLYGPNMEDVIDHDQSQTDFLWVANRAIRRFEDMAWFNHSQEEG